jgi:hypothetical protein
MGLASKQHRLKSHLILHNEWDPLLQPWDLFWKCLATHCNSCNKIAVSILLSYGQLAAHDKTPNTYSDQPIDARIDLNQKDTFERGQFYQRQVLSVLGLAAGGKIPSKFGVSSLDIDAPVLYDRNVNSMMLLVLSASL